MPEAKSYDGNHPVVHVVGPGESLSRIAQQYRLPHWHAIWLYNTVVRKIYLGSDPDVIRAGERLFIPRRPEGYDRLIKRLLVLRGEIEAAGDQQIYALEAQSWDYRAFTEKLDFAGDALTTIATFGIKAGSAARAATVAEATTGRGRVAAQYLAEKEAEKLATWANSAFKDEVKKAAAKKLDGYHEKATGRPTTVGESTHKALSTSAGVIKAIRGFSMVRGKFLLDSAEIALSFLSPSKLANIYLAATTGDSVDSASAKAVASVRATVQRSIQELDEKIGRIADERNKVYPADGSTVGRYIHFPPLHISVGPQRPPVK